MAKLRKVSMYILDERESYEGSEDDIMEELRRSIGPSELQPDLIDVETVRFPWNWNASLESKEDYENLLAKPKKAKAQIHELVEDKYYDLKDVIEKAMWEAGVESPDDFSVVEFLAQMQEETEERMKR